MERRGISRANGRKRRGDTPPKRGGDRRSGQVYFDTLPSAMRELRELYNQVRSGRVRGAGVYRINMQVGILRVWIEARKFIETMQMKTSDAELVRRVQQARGGHLRHGAAPRRERPRGAEGTVAMGKLDSLLQKLKGLQRRAESLREHAFPEACADGLAPIATPEDRALAIRFMREVYHQGMDERVWRAKHPEEYRRIVRIAGTVPAAGKGA